ncbi:MAG: RsmE family RNA methyltransferase [Bradyrhizobiaceae bacterium]|nr:RsmE family RNA methyltransferase [Bradyrhizobiaceae bacterium]
MDNVFDPSVPTVGTYQPSADAQRHVRALRIREGESVRVLNGAGTIVVCRAAAGGQLEVVDVTQTPKPPSTILAMGRIDHRDRMEFAIEKAAELGCTDFIPLITDYSARERVTTERMQSKAVAALTQSGNAWLMTIHAATTLNTLLASLHSDIAVIVGDADGIRPTVIGSLGQGAMVLVGPEGGFSVREQEMIDQRAPIRWAINAQRLRTETAAVALLSVLSVQRV